MYSVVKFSDKDGGSVSVINNQWFTPRRCEVFWPPVRGTKAFEKVLTETKTPDEKWKLYGVQRVFCETNDIEKAKKELKLVEDTSDLQTESEAERSLKRKREIRYFSSSDDDQDNHIRPPTLKNKLTFQAAGNVEASGGETLTLLDVVDGLPVSTNNPLHDLAEDGEGRLTPVARLDSPRCRASPRAEHLGRPRQAPDVNGRQARDVKERQTGNTEKNQTQGRPKISHYPDLGLGPARPRRRYEQTPNLDSEGSATPSCGQGLSGYQAKVLSLLSCIKSQNDQIMSLLKHKDTLKSTLKPELKFPIQNADEVNTIESLLEKKENYDNLVSYMRTFGGSHTSSKVSRIMKFCFTDHLAQQYNFYGRRSNKRPFCQLRLRDCIVEGVVTTTSGCTAKIVEDYIKIWLKHAPERLKKRTIQEKTWQRK